MPYLYFAQPHPSPQLENSGCCSGEICRVSALFLFCINPTNGDCRMPHLSQSTNDPFSPSKLIASFQDQDSPSQPDPITCSSFNRRRPSSTTLSTSSWSHTSHPRYRCPNHHRAVCEVFDVHSFFVSRDLSPEPRPTEQQQIIPPR